MFREKGPIHGMARMGLQMTIIAHSGIPVGDRNLTDDVYTLYGDHRSGNCYKVALLFGLTDRNYRWVETDVLKAESRRSTFLEMNPKNAKECHLLS